MGEDRQILLLGDGENTLQLGRTESADHLVAVLRTPDLTARQGFQAEERIAEFSDLARLLSGLAEDWKGFDLGRLDELRIEVERFFAFATQRDD